MSVSNAAYSKGRQKILHTAFIELNELAIVGATYTDKSQYKRYLGHRVLAVDGSKVRLPNTDDVKMEFGTLYFSNQDGASGEHAFALASTLYDVENKIALDSILAHTKSSEKDLAINHLKHVQKDDLIIFDRGYSSYELMSNIVENKAHFVIRVSSKSFKQAQEMFKDDSLQDETVTLVPSTKLARKQRDGFVSIKDSLNVRFVKVILNTGEVEILATSLLDTEKYPQKTFKEIYWKRWDVETFYSKLKTRLELENFTGKSAECVKQDFYSSVFLTGLESILTEDVDKKLAKKTEKKTVSTPKHKQQVNKAVSFNIIKNRAFDILLEQKSIDKIIPELEALFLTNPTLYRPHRKTPRKEVRFRRLVNFLKRKKKYVF